MRILGWPVHYGIVGRIWLFTTSLRLIISLVPGLVIPGLPLLVIRGWLVGTVLLCKHLSQWSRWSKGGGLNSFHRWCIVDLGRFQCHKCGHLSHVLLCWPSQGLILLWWRRLCVRSCGFGLGHPSCIVWSLVLVGNTSSVAWLWWYCRWCQMVLWLVGDRTYDVICGMGCPRCIPVGGSCTGSVWNDSVKVSRLYVDQIKPLGFHDGLLFGLGMFGCDVLCYRW